MPYKDRLKQKEAVKKAVKKHRVLQEGITPQGITGNTSYYKDGIEMVQADGSERPRYLKLTDGQVFDRANQPKGDITRWPGWRIEALRRLDVKFVPLKGNKALPGLKERYAVK